MYQTLGPFWRAVLDISWGRFCIYYGPFWFGPFWLIRSVLHLGLGRFDDQPFSFIPVVFLYYLLISLQSAMSNCRLFCLISCCDVISGVTLWLWCLCARWRWLTWTLVLCCITMADCVRLRSAISTLCASSPTMTSHALTYRSCDPDCDDYRPQWPIEYS